MVRVKVRFILFYSELALLTQDVKCSRLYLVDMALRQHRLFVQEPGTVIKECKSLKLFKLISTRLATWKSWTKILIFLEVLDRDD